MTELPPPSFSEKQILEKTSIIMLIRGYSPEEVQQFAYVSIPFNKLEPFKAAVKTGDFDVGDYGAILAGGEGDPTPDTMQYIEDEYNFSHQDIAYVDIGEK